MIRTQIDVRTGWGAELARDVNAAVRVDVQAAAEDGAAAARDGASRRRRGSDSMADIVALKVKGTPTGWESGFRSPKFYAPFQSQGTLKSRSRQVKEQTRRRRESASGAARFAKVSGSQGIAPLRFQEHGRTVMRKSLLERLARRFGATYTRV